MPQLKKLHTDDVKLICPKSCQVFSVVKKIVFFLLLFVNDRQKDKDQNVNVTSLLQNFIIHSILNIPFLEEAFWLCCS